MNNKKYIINDRSQDQQTRCVTLIMQVTTEDKVLQQLHLDLNISFSLFFFLSRFPSLSLYLYDLYEVSAVILLSNIQDGTAGKQCQSAPISVWHKQAN